MIFISVLFAIICVIGLFFIQGDMELKEEIDILDIQKDIDNSISLYGYTLDNPRVIVDPYGESYNTALVMFETKDYVSINVSVNGLYSYDTEISNRHYIGLYGLNDGENSVRLSYSGNYKDVVINIVKKDDSKYIDVNNGVILKNNHLIVSTGNYMKDGVYTGFREIDAFGKVYYEYILEDGYSGLVCEIDDLRLAYFFDNKVNVVDRQENRIIVSYDVSNYLFDWKYLDYIDDKLVLYSDSLVITIDNNGNIKEENVEYFSEDFSGNVNYRNVSGVRFDVNRVTDVSKKKVWLFNYDKYDDNGIVIRKEFDRLVVESEDDFYLVLDKLLARRVYKLSKGINYIYTGELSGKYSVYYVIDNDIYKSKYYVRF